MGGVGTGLRSKVRTDIIVRTRKRIYVVFGLVVWKENSQDYQGSVGRY